MALAQGAVRLVSTRVTSEPAQPPITGWEGYFLLVWHAPVGRWITC
jgi:hypothetical protein